MSNPPISSSQPQEKSSRRGSLRRTIQVSLFGFAFLGVLVVIIISVLFANSLSQRASTTLSNSLQRELESNMEQINSSAVQQSDQVLQQAAQAVEVAAAAVGDLYNPQNTNLQEAADEYYPLEAHVQRGPDGQFLNSLDDITSIFVPAPPEGSSPPNTSEPFDPLSGLTSQQQRDLQLSAYIEYTFEAIFQTTPNATAIYFGTPHDVTRYYPNIGLGQLVPADFSVSQRPWYLTAMETNAGLAPDQQRPVWSPVYLDATGQGLVTTVAMPVFGSNPQAAGTSELQVVGVVGMDLKLEQLGLILSSARPFNSGYSFLIDSSGKSILFPVQAYLDFLGRLPNQDEIRSNGFGSDLSTAYPGFNSAIEDMRAARRGLQRVQGFDQAYYIVYSPLENTPWSLASVIAEKEVLASVFTLQADLQTVTQNQILTRVLPAIFLLFVLLIVVGIALTNRLVTPLETLADAAQSTAASWDDAHRQVQAAPTASVSPLQELAQRRDEIGSLAAAMQQLTRRFELRLEAQNVRLDEQNSVLLQGSKQVQIALEVGRSISDQDAHPPELSSGQTNAADLQKMLFEAVNLIADSFEFYNVGLFLIDESHGLAILHAASGDVGAQLVSKMLKLRVGQQGMVGYVTSQGQARVAEDVQEDRTYQPEPLLPETRSEAAFPLRAGKRVIGALDVQSNRLEAFDDFTVMGLQNVADHLAGVIYRMQQRIAFQQAGGDAGRASIAKAALPASHLGFEYNPSLALLSGGVREIFEPVSDVPFYPAQGAASESQGALNAFDLSSPLAQQGILHVPVRLRDEVIGFIRLESEDSGHVWTADELAIAEATANQAALSVENARLLAETRRRAELEQAAAEITAQMRASLDLDTVLQTVVQQIALRMNLDNVEIRLAALQPAGELELGHTSPGDPESELREC